MAGFLGVSNLLEGEVAGADGSLVDRQAGRRHAAACPGRWRGELADRCGSASGRRSCGSTRGAEAGASNGLNALSGTVLDASYIGVSTQYLVQTAEGHRLTVYAQNLDTAGAGELLADGQRVTLTWKPQHTFVISGPAEHVAGDPHTSEEGETDE